MTDRPIAISRLEIVPIRQVFKKESRNFTTWLERHIEALGERIGLELNVVQREKAVGSFNVDLLCEDEAGRPVIVENQLEKTDHDHLGKLLTYLVNLDAVAAIWVSPDPRREHQKVVDWLNESTPADLAFYLVRVEATRIADSPYAPLFTVVAAPTEQAKEIGEGKKEWAERQKLRHDFWTGLLDRSRGKTKLFSAISPSRQGWISAGAGWGSGVAYTFTALTSSAGVELYIDYDRDTGAKNKQIFDKLYSQKAQIEKEFGEQLEWDRLDDRRASRIRYKIGTGGIADQEKWPDLQEEMIDAMVRFEKAIRPRLEKVRV